MQPPTDLARGSRIPGVERTAVLRPNAIGDFVFALPALVALLERAHVLVSNDTGPLHLAHAIGTPSVGIFWMLNLLSGQPLFAGEQRFAFSTRIDCPVCGVRNVRTRCGHDASYVDEVTVDEVRALALERFRNGRCASGRAPGPT